MNSLLTINNVWMMLCTALIFFMHLGFSFLEIGLTRQKILLIFYLKTYLLSVLAYYSIA